MTTKNQSGKIARKKTKLSLKPSVATIEEIGDSHSTLVALQQTFLLSILQFIAMGANLYFCELDSCSIFDGAVAIDLEKEIFNQTTALSRYPWYYCLPLISLFAFFFAIGWVTYFHNQNAVDATMHICESLWHWSTLLCRHRKTICRKFIQTTIQQTDSSSSSSLSCISTSSCSSSSSSYCSNSNNNNNCDKGKDIHSHNSNTTTECKRWCILQQKRSKCCLKLFTCKNSSCTSSISLVHNQQLNHESCQTDDTNSSILNDCSQNQNINNNNNNNNTLSSQNNSVTNKLFESQIIIMSKSTVYIICSKFVARIILLSKKLLRYSGSQMIGKFFSQQSYIDSLTILNDRIKQISNTVYGSKKTLSWLLIVITCLLSNLLTTIHTTITTIIILSAMKMIKKTIKIAKV